MKRHVATYLLVLALPIIVLGPLCAQERPAAYRSQVTPSAPQYALPVDIAALTNPGVLVNLTAEQKQQLASQGFIIIPDILEQMFFLYEEYATLEDQDPVPNFITVDSMLQAYHMFFNYSLRQVESTRLIPAAIRMTELCRFHSAKFYNQLPPGPVRDATARNAAFFAVAESLLKGVPAVASGVGPEMDTVVRQEVELINAHALRAVSPLLGTTTEYTLFNPRGHYTRTPELSRYFRAMTWYGTVGLLLDSDNEELARAHQLQALLITKILAGDDNVRSQWATIYEPTNFFVGASDDLGYRQYVDIAREAFGQRIELEAMQNPALVSDFLALARETLPEPQIAPFFLEADGSGNLLEGTGDVQKRQFRFMGQRFIPDSYILQQLVSPLVQPVSEEDARNVPMGLDVMAALGSDRALDILVSHYQQDRYPRYLQQMEKMRGEFGAKPESEWWQNLYWGWVYSLKGLIEERGNGYPTFMQGTAWHDKQLQSSLSSWAQLRHDTILYAKASGAEMGGDMPPEVQGWVEPVPEVWGRLAYLSRLSRSGLEQRGLLSPELLEVYESFESELLFLKKCAEAHLTGTPLSRDDYERIQVFGGTLERLQLQVVEPADDDHSGGGGWYSITNVTDRHMATIADIHTSFGSALHVGVGPAYRLYVIVPRQDGRLQVAKGGVFSYFEFLWPADDRLTDEKWIEMIQSGQTPPQQEWLQNIVVPPIYPTPVWD